MSRIAKFFRRPLPKITLYPPEDPRVSAHKEQEIDKVAHEILVLGAAMGQHYYSLYNLIGEEIDDRLYSALKRKAGSDEAAPLMQYLRHASY